MAERLNARERADTATSALNVSACVTFPSAVLASGGDLTEECTLASEEVLQIPWPMQESKACRECTGVRHATSS